MIWLDLFRHRTAHNRTFPTFGVLHLSVFITVIKRTSPNFKMGQSLLLTPTCAHISLSGMCDMAEKPSNPLTHTGENLGMVSGTQLTLVFDLGSMVYVVWHYHMAFVPHKANRGFYRIPHAVLTVLSGTSSIFLWLRRRPHLGQKSCSPGWSIQDMLKCKRNTFFNIW